LLRAQSMPQRVANDLQALVALENDAYAVMGNTQSTTPLRSTIEEIKLRLQKVRDQIQSVLVQDQARFKDEADVLRQRLLLAMGVAVLATVSSIWAARRLLARLIGRFERVVLRLGKGDLQQPIDLHGPSDMRWLGRWLEWLRRRLLSLEESRTQVLRHVSHELKTPLAAMREGANLLAEEVPGTLTVEQSRIVHILQGNAQRLQSLIEGLLRLQQAGHIAECIGFEPLRLDRLIEQVLETSRLIAADKHLEFKSVLAEVEIVAGQEGVLTIVHNLLSNAVKFSPDGGRIGVELSTHREQAVLDVSDEGPGIAAQDRPHIFEPFYRSSASRAITGVGLGLAIAREFVLAHQGELLVLDSPTGAHFRVTLPLNAPLARTRRHA
jgi:two-component system sensor histidine kinase GlrK